jgi:hypothetical protein
LPVPRRTMRVKETATFERVLRRSPTPGRIRQHAPGPGIQTPAKK